MENSKRDHREKEQHNNKSRLKATNDSERVTLWQKHFQDLLGNPKDGVRGAQAKSFFYRCIPIWNELANNVVT